MYHQEYNQIQIPSETQLLPSETQLLPRPHLLKFNLKLLQFIIYSLFNHIKLKPYFTKYEAENHKINYFAEPVETGYLVVISSQSHNLVSFTLNMVLTESSFYFSACS